MWEWPCIIAVNATDLGTYPLLEELDLSRNQVGACPPLCDQSCIPAVDSLLLIFTQHFLNHSLPAVKPWSSCCSFLKSPGQARPRSQPGHLPQVLSSSLDLLDLHFTSTSFSDECNCDDFRSWPSWTWATTWSPRSTRTPSPRTRSSALWTSLQILSRSVPPKDALMRSSWLLRKRLVLICFLFRSLRLAVWTSWASLRNWSSAETDYPPCQKWWPRYHSHRNPHHHHFQLSWWPSSIPKAFLISVIIGVLLRCSSTWRACACSSWTRTGWSRSPASPSTGSTRSRCSSWRGTTSGMWQFVWHFKDLWNEYTSLHENWVGSYSYLQVPDGRRFLWSWFHWRALSW